MRLKIASAVKAVTVLTAAGLLLGGCYYHPRAVHGGPHYAAPAYGHYKHHHGKGRGQVYHHRQRHGHHGHRGHW